MSEVKYIIMDNLKKQHPEKFNESGAMDYKWFEAEVRPNYNCFIRLDVNSVSFSFGVENAPLTQEQAAEFLKNAKLSLLKGVR